MNPPINLTRKIRVKSWHFSGTVAEAVPRPWEIAVLKQALADGVLTANDVERHLGIRTPVASRILQVCEASGLMMRQERQYKLTESGAESAKTELVYIPESGVWQLWASDHPLLPFPVLKIERSSEPRGVDEAMGVKARNGRQTPKTRSFTHLPEWLLKLRGSSGAPAFNKGKSFRIDEYGKMEIVEQGEDTEVRLSLSISSAAIRLNLSETILGDTVDVDAPIDIRNERAWLDLLASAGRGSDWDEKRGALRVSFQSLMEVSERRQLLQEIEFRNPTLPIFGTFDSTKVVNVRIIPRTQVDAEEWSHWRLLDNINNFASNRRIAEWQKEAITPFEPEFTAELPCRRELINQITSNAPNEMPTKVYWFLQAAEDFNL